MEDHPDYDVLCRLFPIPMRGNEMSCVPFEHTAAGFPIPMRGNEFDDRLGYGDEVWFPIPMRGNEYQGDGHTCDVYVVPDPHEG